MRKFQVSPQTGRGKRAIIIGGDTGQSHFLLGRLSEVGPERQIRLDTSKEHVVAVVGKRGSGKTHTLGVLVEGLSASDATGVLSRHSSERAVLVFDTLNLFQWIGIPLKSAIGAIGKIQFSKAKAWGLPEISITPKLWHLAGSTPASSNSVPFMVQTSDMTPQDWGLLMDIDIVSEPMGQLVSAAYDKVTRTGWKSASKMLRPLTRYSIGDLIKCIIEDQELSDEFTPETRRAIRQRLSAYDRTGLFSTNGTSLEDLLSPNLVSVLLLARAPEDLRTLVVFLLIRRILDQRSAASELAKASMISGERASIPSVPKTWIFLDEAQNVIPSRTTSIANRELTRFVREGRNFGLSIAISTQQPIAIDARVMAQVDILISHTLTVRQDTSYILSNLKSPPPETLRMGRRTISFIDSLRELDVGQCLISAVDSPRTYYAEIRPRVTPHGGFEA